MLVDLKIAYSLKFEDFFSGLCIILKNRYTFNFKYYFVAYVRFLNALD